MYLCINSPLWPLYGSFNLFYSCWCPPFHGIGRSRGNCYDDSSACSPTISCYSTGGGVARTSNTNTYLHISLFLQHVGGFRLVPGAIMSTSYRYAWYLLPCLPLNFQEARRDRDIFPLACRVTCQRECVVEESVPCLPAIFQHIPSVHILDNNNSLYHVILLGVAGVVNVSVPSAFSKYY